MKKMISMMIMIRGNGWMMNDDFYSPQYCSTEDFLSKYNDDDDDDDSEEEEEEEEDDNIQRFKKIDGYPNYCASTFGHIRNDTTNHILKPGKDTDGYHLVILYE